MHFDQILLSTIIMTGDTGKPKWFVTTVATDGIGNAVL